MSKKKERKEKRNSQQQEHKRRPTPTHCPVCEAKIELSYKNWEALAKFVSDRKKIMNRTRTGVCSKHQRILAREIKRARHLALLPFSVRI